MIGLKQPISHIIRTERKRRKTQGHAIFLHILSSQSLFSISSCISTAIVAQFQQQQKHHIIITHTDTHTSLLPALIYMHADIQSCTLIAILSVSHSVISERARERKKTYVQNCLTPLSQTQRQVRQKDESLLLNKTSSKHKRADPKKLIKQTKAGSRGGDERNLLPVRILLLIVSIHFI